MCTYTKHTSMQICVCFTFAYFAAVNLHCVKSVNCGVRERERGQQLECMYADQREICKSINR